MRVGHAVLGCILVAMSLLALAGLRYRARLLSVLLFECASKLIWLSVFAAPKLLAGTLDAATQGLLTSCLPVLIILPVVPWRFVWGQ